MLSCPDSEDLQRFLVGQVSDEEMRDIEAHLEQCPDCLRAMRDLQTRDTLVEAFRSQGRGGGPRLDDNLEALIRRLEQLPQATVAAGRETDTPSPTVDSPSSAARTATSATEAYRFLLPPQVPDEMGRLGAYRVLGVLGSGGMGVVFRAEDTRLHRMVALKVLQPALADNPTAHQRFLREARSAAAVEHEHVVHINEVGEDHGIPFVSMPLLQGESLDARTHREDRLPAAEVLRIGRETAEGLAAAHKRGLIHRDIKPANIWLEGERGKVKLLDFGLARLETDSGQVTQSGFVVGTPAFMAPEQARGEPVDARADLFSLGCVLYRLGTGRLPFAGASTLQVLHALATQEPAPAGELNPELPPALAALIHRLLCKDAAGRPASAREVAQTLAALERGEAIAPPTPLVPLRSASRTAVRRGDSRRFLLLGLFLAVLALAAALFWVSLWRGAASRGDVGIEPSRAASSEPPPASAFPLTLRGAGDPIRGVAFSPDGRLVAAAAGQRTVVWDLATGKEKVQLNRSTAVFFYGIAFSPDGKRLVSGTNRCVRSWDVQTGSVVLEKAVPGDVWSLACSPDGQFVLSTSMLWNAGGPDIHGGHLVAWRADTGADHVVYDHSTDEAYYALAYSPNGQRVAASVTQMRLGKHFVRIWEADSGKLLHKLASPRLGSSLSALSFSPDSQLLASAGYDGTIRLWDVNTGQELPRLRKADGGCTVAFSPDGRRLVSGGEFPEHQFRIWNLDAGRPSRVFLLSHPGVQVAFSPDGRRVAAGGGNAVTIWDTSQPADAPPTKPEAP